MTENYKTLLIDMMWTYKKELFSDLVTTKSTKLSIIDYGYKHEDSDLFDYEYVTICDDGVIKKGNVKFVNDVKQFNRWKDANPLSSRLVVLVLCCDPFISSLYSSDFSIAVVEIPEKMNKKYLSLIYSHQYCGELMASLDTFKRESILHRLVIDRCEMKEEILRERYKNQYNDINELLLFTLFDTFLIATKNQDPMRELFKTIKGCEILKALSTREHVEALLLGCAGMLDSIPTVDDYFVKLRKIYVDLSLKFSLRAIGEHRWTYSSTMTKQGLWIMLAHFASFLHHHKDLLFKIIEIRKMDDILSLFNVPLGDYWHNYASKNRISENKEAQIPFSKVRKNAMIINGIIPFLFFYHKEHNNGDFSEITGAIMDMLLSIDKETHTYTRMWTRDGVPNRNAFDSQGLTQLGKCYCNNKLCAKCPIGITILLS